MVGNPARVVIEKAPTVTDAAEHVLAEAFTSACRDALLNDPHSYIQFPIYEAIFRSLGPREETP